VSLAELSSVGGGGGGGGGGGSVADAPSADFTPLIPKDGETTASKGGEGINGHIGLGI